MTQQPLIPADVNAALTHTGRAARRAPHPMADHHSKHWRGVRARWCPGCRTPILTGLDADQCALLAKADPTPLTALGEAMALLDGRATYTLTRDHGRSIVTLSRRTAGTITRQPAGADVASLLAWDIIGEHRCGQTTPDELTAATRLADLTVTATDQPPF